MNINVESEYFAPKFSAVDPDQVDPVISTLKDPDPVSFLLNPTGNHTGTFLNKSEYARIVITTNRNISIKITFYLI